MNSLKIFLFFFLISPLIQRGLCRHTFYKNENDETIRIDYDDLMTIRELGSGQYGTVLKYRHTRSDLILAAKVFREKFKIA